MNRSLICCSAFLLLAGARAGAQLPETCKLPASAAQPPAGTAPARVYDAEGVWFAGQGDLQCAAAAFKQAIRLEPHLAEAHFDLGLIRQSQQQPAGAASEFRLALEYDPTLLQAHCALGSVLPEPSAAEAEFRSALETDPNMVCALDGLAHALLNEGHYDAAMDYWRQAVRLQPDAVDLQLSLATATYKAAKARQAAGLPEVDGAGVADAVQLFTELLKSHPDLTAAHFTLGNIYANEHRSREAADEYQVVTRQDPANTDALGAEVKALLNVSAYTDALAPARNFVSRKPNDASAHIMLGMAYRGMGDYAKAEPELELGAAREPDDFEAQYQLGFVLAHLGKPQEALPKLRRAVQLNPAEKSAQFQLATVLRQLGEKQEADQVFEKVRQATDNDFQKSQATAEGIKANDLLQAGKAADAAQIYRHMLEEEPDNAWTAYNLALALEAVHDLTGAEDALHKGINIDPKLAKIRAELGQLKFTEGDSESAQKWLESALELDPQLVEARGNLAMVYAKKGDLVTAEKLLRQALEDDPSFKDGHLELGLILARQNRKPEAEKEFDEAVKLAPKDPATLSTVGKAKMQMGKSSEGIALLEKVVDLAPDLAASHLDLALALADSYDLPAALTQTDEAVRLAPKSGVAHFYRGRILYDLGRTTEAKPEFETACREDTQMAEPRYFLALIDRHDGNFALASGLLEEAVKLQPDNVMDWYSLGQTLEQQSETTKAIAAWRQALAIDPKFSAALFSLAHTLRPTDQAESEQLMARYVALQKERHILDRTDLLANDGVEAETAHDWPAAIRQLKEAIAACGDCVAQADLHRKLGIIDCQAGDLNNGEKELLTAKALKPADPVTQAALELIAQARSRHSASVAGKAH
jgi:tetratricopeptide (TPR) repeat protein